MMTPAEAREEHPDHQSIGRGFEVSVLRANRKVAGFEPIDDVGDRPGQGLGDPFPVGIKMAGTFSAGPRVKTSAKGISSARCEQLG